MTNPGLDPGEVSVKEQGGQSCVSNVCPIEPVQKMKKTALVSASVTSRLDGRQELGICLLRGPWITIGAMVISTFHLRI